MTTDDSSVVGAQGTAAPADKLSYALGLNMGHGMKQQGITVDAGSFVAGLQAGLSGGKPAFGQQELHQILGEFQRKMAEKHKKTAGQSGAEAKSVGAAFLAENGKQEGVTTTASGLQYKVLASGQGKKAKAKDRVQVHYKGTLPDGTVFDSSYDRGKPASFQVDGVIPGWTEALQLMREGDKWLLVIPSELAYGQRGAGGRIGPNQVLVFEVELLKVGAATP
ncbi:MAG: FKBP-type peptidyl-prolyl cis-trans isomerase [Pirellulaceae bacterium]